LSLGVFRAGRKHRPQEKEGISMMNYPESFA
jgi:hypothetical protein